MLVYKKFHGDSCNYDWLRVLKLFEASKQSTAFNAPEPVRLCLEDNIIEYKHFPEGELLAYKLFKVHISRVNRRTTQLNDLFERIGRALADLHYYYQLPGTESLRLDISSISDLKDNDNNYIFDAFHDAPLAAFHGDFCLGNVWIQTNNMVPYIFDPIPSQFCPAPLASRAPIYYDIAHMVSTLWCLYPLWVYPFVNHTTIRKYISSFLNGYEAETGNGLKLKVVYGVALWLIDAYMKRNSHEFKGISGKLRRHYFQQHRTELVREICL